MSRFDVVGFGALNMDKLFKVNGIAAAEEENFVTDFVQTCGGSAANTVVGLARLGCKVGFVGKVAGDLEGKILTEEFHKENVNTGGITVAKQGRSGTVMGFVDEKGDRALYIDPGVNDEIELNETNKKYASQTRFIHLTSFVGEQSFQTQEKIVRSLSKNAKVSFDPGALYAKKGFAALRTIIKNAYVALPNAGELEHLTGKAEYRKGAETLLNEGVQIVAVKLGSRGCYIASKEEECFIEPVKVRVIDTTGAGDAFNAGFLYGLIRRRSLHECGQIGNFVASRCITRMGARTALPTLAELKNSGLA
jgi:ribokinase